MENKCEYCKEGFVEVLMNYEGYHYNGERPIIEKVPCEECGGTGFQQNRRKTKYNSEYMQEIKPH